MGNIWVNGIVAVRDGQPYVQLSNEDGIIAQFSVGEARSIANNIMLMASRTEADALLLDWTAKMDLPKEAGAQLMQLFRDFRAKIDDEVVETGYDKGPEEKG